MFNFLKAQAKSKYSIFTNLSDIVGRYWIIAIVFASILLLFYSITFLTEQAKGEFRITEYSSFVDDTSEITFQSILHLPEKDWFKTQDLKLKAISGRLWLKVELPDSEQQSVLLHFNDPLIDQVTIRVVDHSDEVPQILAEFEAGDLQAFGERALRLPYFVIPFELGQGSTTLYMSASSKLSVNLSFGLWSNDGFIEFNDHLTTFLGIVFGYVMALLSYSFMMYATARRTEYFWYGLYLSAFFLHAMTLSGYGFQYLWPYAVGLQTIMGGATISIAFACLAKFTQVIIATNNKTYNFLFNIQVYLHLILSLLSIYTLNTVFLNFHLIAVLFSSLMVPVICLLAGKEGSKTSVFFSLVWLVFLVTSIVSILGRIEVLSLNFDPLYSLFLGFHMQTLLVGSALVYEYRKTSFQTLKLKETALLEKEKTVSAKDQILKLQQDAQNKLEQQVKAQTMQLEGALSHLSSASTELKLMHNVDGLTGLPNRLAFDEALQKLSKLSIDKGEALCVAVLDIDYFKNVNDTYGHIAGDDCLREFSALMKATFVRDDYACCRFGGEEFTLASVLPIDIVEKQVNVFRVAVENMTIESGGHNISFTTSAGIASKRLSNEADSMGLLSAADENLYLAKQKGRNLVIA